MKFIFAVFALFGLSFAAAQTAATEEPLQQYNLLDSLYLEIAHSDLDKALEYSEKQIDIALSLHSDSLAARAYIHKCDILWYLDEYETTITQAFLGLDYAQKTTNTTLIAELYRIISTTHRSLNNYPKAIEYGKIALKYYALSKNSKRQDVINMKYELGGQYCMMDNDSIAQGEKWVSEAIEEAKQIKDSTLIAKGLAFLSNSYYLQDNYTTALQYLLQARPYIPLHNTAFLLDNHYNLGNIYMELGEWDKANEQLDACEKMCLLIGEKDYLADCFYLRADINARQGNYETAYDYLMTYTEKRDSLFQESYLDKIADMETKYKLKAHQQEIALLQKDKELDALKLQEAATMRNYIIIIGVSVLFFTVFGVQYYNQQKRKRLHELFAQQLIATQEEERQRISQELHDHIGQNVLFIKNELIQKNKDGALSSVLDTVSTTIEEVREMSKNLYPNQLDKYGLAASVDLLSQKVSDSTGIFVSSDFSQVEEFLSKEVKINFYRIIQEAINNVIKHAEATSVRITAEREKNQVHLLIQDNGKGFDGAILAQKATRSFGVLNMEERAKLLQGKFELDSEPGKGTRLRVSLPIAASL